MSSYNPTWDLSTIPDQVFKSEDSRRKNALRTTRTGGRNGGRPRVADRCPCGKWTRLGALKRKHQCVIDGQYPEVGQ